MRAFTKPFVEDQYLSVIELKSEVKNPSAAHKISLFKEKKNKRAKHQFYENAPLKIYFLQIKKNYLVCNIL